MNSTPRFPINWPLIEIGNKHNSSKVLLLIDLKEAFNIDPGNTYLYHFPGTYYNVSISPVFCSRIPGRYFDAFNKMV